ncbi:hypothetical protein QA648_29030 (plasmid) [Rhizobium sp. CB3171]|uniref:hypothetical protein n=1 Tax=unclassified Rhizobium TaxID=2613769 RepID=UPI000CF24FEF|nr:MULTISPECIES: hypothetical protein [Rhizobium]UWU23876.1 hypothetical protein N2601_26915 [Rhizobium tropici]WFU04804.1 hypothetical protein QA648_29030 [Rhizobium sp. CB3171]
MYAHYLKPALFGLAILIATGVPTYWLAKKTFEAAIFENGLYLALLPVYPVVWIAVFLILSHRAVKTFRRR